MAQQQLGAAPSRSADKVSKGYVDSRPAIFADTDGVPYWAPGSGTSNAPTLPGTEIAYAATATTANISDGWTDIEGLEIYISNDIPARINLNIGLVVLGPIDATVGRGVEYRILNSTSGVAVAYASFYLPAPVNGFTSQGSAPLSARLDATAQPARYSAQIKAVQTGTPGYIVPPWLPDARAELFMIGV